MFRPGDRVRFLNETGEATVIQMIDATQVLIEDESGFDYPYPAKELVKIEDPSSEEQAYRSKQLDYRQIVERNVDQGALSDAKKDFKSKYKDEKQGGGNQGDKLVIDLHIHELVDSDTGLDPHDKLQIQLEHFERMMKRAEEQHIRQLVFIHGVGQGILRNEIRKNLEQYYPNAEYYDANYQEFGYGATEVRLRIN
jgi:DNA-nicking Smr family endonuclease